MQQDDPDPASRQGCTDLLRAALVQLKLVHKAVAEGGPLQELVQACVTAVEAFVEVAKVVVVPVGDAVVFVRLNEATTNVQLELANLQAAGLTVDLEADSALGKQTLEQALHAVAHHVAYIGTLATNLQKGTPSAKQQRQLAISDGNLLTTAFSKSVSTFVNVIAAELKTHIMYTAADVLVNAGRLNAYLHASSKIAPDPEGPVAAWNELQTLKGGLVDEIVAKASTLMLNAKLAQAATAAIPADLKEACTVAAKLLAEQTKQLLLKAKAAGVMDHKLLAVNITPAFRDLLATITIDPKSSGPAVLMELAVKTVVSGISKILENTRTNAAQLEDGLKLLQRALGDITTEVAKIEMPGSQMNEFHNHDQQANRQHNILSPTESDGESSLGGSALTKNPEELVDPIIVAIAKLKEEGASDWASSEEYLETLRTIEFTSEDLFSWLHRTHPTTQKLQLTLDEVVNATHIAAGPWPGPTAVSDMDAKLTEFAALLKKFVQEEAEDMGKGSSIFYTSRRSSMESSKSSGNLVGSSSFNGSLAEASDVSSDSTEAISRPRQRRWGLRIETATLSMMSLSDSDENTNLIAALQRLAMQVKLRISELSDGADHAAWSDQPIKEAAGNLALVAKKVVGNHLNLIFKPALLGPVPAVVPKPTASPQSPPPVQAKQSPPVHDSPSKKTAAAFYTTTPASFAAVSAHVKSPPPTINTSPNGITSPKPGKFLTSLLPDKADAPSQLLAQKSSLFDLESPNLKSSSDEALFLPESMPFVTGVALSPKNFAALLADDVTDLVLDPPSTPNERPVIRGGSVKQLADRLTYYKYPDTDYIEAFLLTYRSFMQPLEVLDAIITRYDQQAPLDMSKAQFDQYYKIKVIPTRLRVFNFMKIWVDKHFEDFADEGPLEERLLLFVTERRTHHYYQGATMNAAAAQLKKFYEKKKRSYFQSISAQLMMSSVPSSLSLSTLTMRLSDVDINDLAKQMAMLDHTSFRAIKPHECLNQAWNKPEIKHRSPNILAFIKCFNELTKRVTFEILSTEVVKDRASTVKFFIALCQKCLALNNFNSLNAILAALSSSSVRRLAKTWDLVPKKSTSAFEDMNKQMSHESNYNTYRAILHSVDPPCVPFLGVSLTDLTFIEQGNKDYVSPGIVNFDKCRKTAESIREIQRYQQASYSIAPIAHIHSLLLNGDVVDCTDNDFYEMSINLEARKK